MAENAIFGINSNLDTSGIIDNLVTLQRQPIKIVEAKRSLEEAKLLSFKDFKDLLQNFKMLPPPMRASNHRGTPPLTENTIASNGIFIFKAKTKHQLFK